MAAHGSLPSYSVPSLIRAPSYSVEPGTHEHRIALNDNTLPRPTGYFIKQSRSGDLVLKLAGQPQNIGVPHYGSCATVAGTVEIAKPNEVNRVEILTEGRLKLKEIAEGGSDSVKVCAVSCIPWSRSPRSPHCPALLSFSLTLPRTFNSHGATYPIPPTYTTKLPGMPGFFASIDYRITVSLSLPTTPKILMKKTPIFGAGSSSVSTPFIYNPRTRPSHPLPLPLYSSPQGLIPAPEWRCFESLIKFKTPGHQDIKTKLFLPSSRIFYMGQAVPFHVQYESSSFSLSAFLPYGPSSHGIPARWPTKIQMMRQTIVDVRNADVHAATALGHKTDIWRVDNIGNGSFTHSSDGPTWIAFSGLLDINNDVKITSFKAAGLSVKDCILFTMTPLEPQKCPFKELRLVVPIRLTTDPWTSDGTGVGGRFGSDSDQMSIPSSPSEETLATPNLHY